MIPEISRILHEKLASVINPYSPKTILDIGGKGRLAQFVSAKVTDANIENGIDGCNLPYERNSFDVTCSNATLEHARDQNRFLDEAIRVCRVASVHWFPYGKYAEEVEEMIARYGHHHRCRIPKVASGTQTCIEYFSRLDFWPTVEHHLRQLMKLSPQLENAEVLEYISRNGHQPYGALIQFCRWSA